MSLQQHPKQQNRPSLYEPRETTSAFSILGAAQPLGWSKQKSIGLSIASFIAGGVLSGGAVGLAKSSDQQPLPVLATSLAAPAVAKNISENTAKIAAPVLVTAPIPKTAMNNPTPISNAPVSKNPLASFQDDKAQAVLAKPHAKTHEITANDDADLQRLIERKTQHSQVVAKTNIDNERREKAKLEAETAAKNEKAKKEKSDAIAKQKKAPARDKDVLLVKSMLDTMDHSAVTTSTTKPKVPTDSSN